MNKVQINKIPTTRPSGGILQTTTIQNSNENSLAQPKQNTKPYLNETELLDIHLKEKTYAIEQVEKSKIIFTTKLFHSYYFHLSISNQFDKEPKYNDDESFSEPFKNKLNNSIEEKYFVFEQQNRLKRMDFIVCNYFKQMCYYNRFWLCLTEKVLQSCTQRYNEKLPNFF